MSRGSVKPAGGLGDRWQTQTVIQPIPHARRVLQTALCHPPNGPLGSERHDFGGPELDKDQGRRPALLGLLFGLRLW